MYPERLVDLRVAQRAEHATTTMELTLHMHTVDTVTPDSNTSTIER